MTPFSEAQTQLKPSLWDRLSARRTPLVFALCVLVGLAMVAGRAKGRLESARDMARTEARACGATLELQFSQVSGAAEALGALAKQGGGAIGNSKWLQEVLRRAQLAELPRQGYDFVFYIPPPFQPKPVPIAAQGLSSLQDTVQQPIRVRNLESRLALKPKGGWINRSQVGLESLGVLLISALVALSVNLIEGRRAIETELKEATQRLARDAADRSQAQADWTAEKERAAAAKVELRLVQAALQQAESKATQAQAQLEASIHTRAETAEIHKAELKKSRAALQESQESTAQVRALLNAAAVAEKEAASVARERLQQDQAAMADLENRLEAITRSARNSAETNTARLAQLEQSNRELQEQLLAAQRTQARVTELEGLLQRAEQELGHRDVSPPRSELMASAESGDAVATATAGDDPWRDLPVVSTEDPNPAPKLSVREPVIEPVDEAIADADPSDNSRAESTEPPILVIVNPTASDELNSVASLETVERLAQVASASESSPVQKTAKAGRRKQTRRDDQLALFGNEALPASPVNQEVVEAEAPPASSPEAAEEIMRPVSPAAPLHTADVEGLATGGDLASAAADPESHLSALRQFAEDHALAPDQIRDALLQGDLPLAQRVLQVLQTAAEKIGATGVHHAATALARACHEHADPGEIELVWSELERGVRELVATFKPVALPKEDKPAPSRRLPPAPPVDPTQLRKAVNLILPLLAERDPGAKDCLKDNRTTFRSTFTPEAYVEFEQLVKSGEFDPALEQLRKAVKKHGISM